MLDEAGGEASKLKLTKWSFLLSREAPNRGGGTFYGFVTIQFWTLLFLDAERASLFGA